jgi:hypothetical protein
VFLGYYCNRASFKQTFDILFMNFVIEIRFRPAPRSFILFFEHWSLQKKFVYVVTSETPAYPAKITDLRPGPYLSIWYTRELPLQVYLCSFVQEVLNTALSEKKFAVNRNWPVPGTTAETKLEKKDQKKSFFRAGFFLENFFA